jgi:hypothetical protein
VHFSHHLPSVDLDRDFAHAEIKRDLLVESPCRDQCHHLSLARGQSLEARAELGDRALAVKPCAVLRQALIDGVKQILGAEWLCQKLYRTILHRLHGHRDIAVTGNEDNREPNVCRREVALEVKATSAWQSDVQHEA